MSATRGLTSASTEAITAIVIAEARTVVLTCSFKKRISIRKHEAGKNKPIEVSVIDQAFIHQRLIAASRLLLLPSILTFAGESLSLASLMEQWQPLTVLLPEYYYREPQHHHPA